MNIKNDYVINLLKNCDTEIYLVGGAVRDYLLGKTTCDKDIIVKNAKQFAIDFANKNNATFITLDEENNIYRVVLKDNTNYVDITQPVNNSLTDDIMRRDFTINALAINLSDFELIDYVNGEQDLKNKIIRSISEQNLKDDSLRILRGYRFASTLGFQIDTETQNQFFRNKELVSKPAIERINYEFLKLLDGRYAYNILLNCPILDILYPVFNDVRKVPENSHHHLPLFEHSVEVVKQIQNIFDNSNNDIQQHLLKKDFGGFSRLAHLKLAGLFHDIGKYSTWTIEEGRHRFLKHDDVGSKMAKKIFKQNKFSNKQIEYITSMIKYHMYPSQIVSSENLTEKNYMKYIRKMGDNVIDNIILAKADRLSTRGADITEEIINNNITSLNKMLDYYLNIKDKLEPLPKLLSGNEIMQLKNIKPSEYLGQIINALKGEQTDGNITTKEDAIKFVENYNE